MTRTTGGNQRSWRATGHAAGFALLLVAAGMSREVAAQDTLPIGYGTLRRDDIVVKFDTDQLEIQVLPLDEQVIRLLAPDTYRSLAALMKTKRAQIDDLAQRAGVTSPTLVLVTFIGLAPQARFTPEDVNIASRGRLFRPIGVVPLSPSWSSNQLDAREQAIAIYLFEPGVIFREALTITYQSLSSDAWTRTLTALDGERARVLARAQAKPNP